MDDGARRPVLMGHKMRPGMPPGLNGIRSWRFVRLLPGGAGVAQHARTGRIFSKPCSGPAETYSARDRVSVGIVVKPAPIARGGA